ncbi:MAG: hypothetical protein LH632_12730 [Rhodoferax sp.]|nr:hypothetical protein [Rhodoferax sp.]
MIPPNPVLLNKRLGEGWEHDDTGNQQNYSGCYDDIMDPIAEHEGWQEGYDY